MNRETFTVEIICCGTLYGVKMLENETWKQLADRALACDRQHISDAEWEMVSAGGMQIPMNLTMRETASQSGKSFYPIYLNPRPGITA